MPFLKMLQIEIEMCIPRQQLALIERAELLPYLFFSADDPPARHNRPFDVEIAVHVRTKLDRLSPI